MSKVLDCGFKVSEFELQLFYHIHFWTNALEKNIEPQESHSYELNCITVCRIHRLHLCRGVRPPPNDWFGFFCLMAYQPSWVI